MILRTCYAVRYMMPPQLQGMDISTVRFVIEMSTTTFPTFLGDRQGSVFHLAARRGHEEAVCCALFGYPHIVWSIAISISVDSLCQSTRDKQLPNEDWLKLKERITTKHVTMSADRCIARCLIRKTRTNKQTSEFENKCRGRARGRLYRG